MSTTSGTRVRIEQVHVRRGGRPVLQDATIEVAPGGITAVVGPSGAGKSTLLRTINGLQPTVSGSVRVGDTEVGASADGSRRWGEREAAALRARVGFVFQDFNLFPHLTARENVVVAQRVVHRLPRDQARANAREALAEVGLREFEDRRPAQLSGGQQQRVAIARALAMNPEVLLFDEATSALDAELAQEVLSVIRRLASRGLTMLMVTHELAFAREVADQLVLLEAGRIVEQGRTELLFTSPRSPRTAAFLGAA